MKYLRLVRPWQWYKNLLVFLALIYSGNLLNVSLWPAALVAFASFCFLSSASYVLNDIADRNRDRLNPENRKRPLASGEISMRAATVLFALLTFAGLGLALFLPSAALFASLGFFVLCQLYTIWLKHEVFADVLVIAINFVLRAVAGAFAIHVRVSPWLIGGVFFLALFLILGKRRSELVLLGKAANNVRSTLLGYTPEIVSRLNSVATTSLVLCYALFVFFGEHQGLFVTLPFALYAIFRYEGLVATGSMIARKPHLVVTDVRMLIAMLLWGILTLFVLYQLFILIPTPFVLISTT